MKHTALTAAALAAGGMAAGGTACAQDVKLTPLMEARVRYEHVEQVGIAADADALTLRARAGVRAQAGPLTATIQAQGTLAAVDTYHDGLHGSAVRPLVADPENVALYLANIGYRAGGMTLTAGRQRIAIDDERFIGNAGFRQNAVTYDAVRAEWTPARGLKLDLSYAWSVRTIWGIEGTGARPRAVGGDNVLANLAYATPVGTVTGFAYLVDQDAAAVQGFRLSSASLGVRIAGVRTLSPAAKLSYAASYATQRGHHRNPNRYRADYWSADATLDLRGWKLNLGYEVLGAGDGTPLTSFQFPLGTNFKFQGWADKFLTTPPDGVRDLYAGIGHGWKAAGPFKAPAVSIGYHRFRSDRLGIAYGKEFDALATARLGKVAIAARFARYRAARFATDTDKFWLQLDWSL